LRARDAQIARDRKLEAPGHRLPVQRRDHRRLQADHQRKDARSRVDARGAACRVGHLAEIAAGTERPAFAGQHDHPHGVVDIGVAQRPGEPPPELAVEGIAPGGPVQRKRQHA
jgi:hypothetical protein